MSYQKLTEEDSAYPDLDKRSIPEILSIINKEDHSVPDAVKKILPQVAALAEAVFRKLKDGGRLFYVGAGTSGRLGILDASEMPPSYGVSPECVQGIIAGGEKAISEAVEFAEDNTEAGWAELDKRGISQKDFIIGITASGSTPFVVHVLEQAKSLGIQTASISNNPGSPVSAISDFPVEVITGPEVVTGSTRMKAATAQKMLLNMISSAVMIRLGHISGNKMVDLKPLNNKLLERGARIIMEKLGISDHDLALELLEKHGSVRKVLENTR